jgi:hypothetical protein
VPQTALSKLSNKLSAVAAALGSMLIAHTNSMPLAGYVLTAIFDEPGRTVLSLREPRGKPPMRIRLLEPRHAPAPARDLPSEGLLITGADWHQAVDGTEELRLDFADGSDFHASCRQVALDIS